MKLITYSCLFLALFCGSCSQEKYKNPHVIIETGLGDIEVELFPDQAPKTVAAFLAYVDSGFYDKSSFYRVLKTDEFPTENNTGIIQGGIWQTNPARKVTIPGIEHETTKQTGLSHQSGTISLARTTPGSANTEFLSVSETRVHLILAGVVPKTDRAMQLLVKYTKAWILCGRYRLKKAMAINLMKK